MEELTEQQSKVVLDLQAQLLALRQQVYSRPSHVEQFAEAAGLTPEALQRIGSGRYGAIVTDMGRDENGHYRADAGRA